MLQQIDQIIGQDLVAFTVHIFEQELTLLHQFDTVFAGSQTTTDFNIGIDFAVDGFQ